MQPHPSRLLFPALLGLLALEAPGQISFKGPGNITMAQRALPAVGPGSALLNPAALSEARMVYGLIGINSAVSAKSGMNFAQVAVSLPPDILPWLPVGFSAGLGRSGNSSKIDNSNAVYLETILVPAFAVSTPPQDPTRSLSLGLAFPIYSFNAFGPVKSRDVTMDLGLLASAETGTGRFRLGYSYHSVLELEIRLPDDRGTYFIPGWMEFSLGWTSPARRVRLHWEQFLTAPKDKSEGPGRGFLDLDAMELGVNGWEIEVRPVPMVGFKVERTRIGGSSSLGIVLNPVLGPRQADLYLEINVGHDRYTPSGGWLLGQGQDEGRGLLMGFTVGGGI